MYFKDGFHLSETRKHYAMLVNESVKDADVFAQPAPVKQRFAEHCLHSIPNPFYSAFSLNALSFNLYVAVVNRSVVAGGERGLKKQAVLWLTSLNAENLMCGKEDIVSLMFHWSII